MVGKLQIFTEPYEENSIDKLQTDPFNIITKWQNNVTRKGEKKIRHCFPSGVHGTYFHSLFSIVNSCGRRQIFFSKENVCLFCHFHWKCRRKKAVSPIFYINAILNDGILKRDSVNKQMRISCAATLKLHTIYFFHSIAEYNEHWISFDFYLNAFVFHWLIFRLKEFAN